MAGKNKFKSLVADARKNATAFQKQKRSMTPKNMKPTPGLRRRKKAMK